MHHTNAQAGGSAADLAGHWEQIYREPGPERVSWFQPDPVVSIELIDAAAGGDSAVSVIDVGGGASLLSARLATAGFTDVTVLDLSTQALEVSRRQDSAGTVSFIQADLLTWRPGRRWRIWHDRAVFHFLTTPADRAAYLTTLRQALTEDGNLILATFAPGGPTRCSGLPVTCYSTDELATEFGADFTLTATRTEQHHTPAGTTQPFTWISARRN